MGTYCILLCVRFSCTQNVSAATDIETLGEAMAVGADASVISFFLFAFYVPQGRPENRLLLFGSSVS